MERMSVSEDRHTNSATKDNIKARLTSFHTPYYSHIPFTWNTKMYFSIQNLLTQKIAECTGCKVLDFLWKRY